MLTQNLSSFGLASETSLLKSCAAFHSLLVFLRRATGYVAKARTQGRQVHIVQ